MKTPPFISLLWLLSSLAFGQAAEPVIVERGPHHRTWERTVTEILGDGSTTERKSSVIELGTSMHYWRDGQWMESQARFRLFPGGAVADEAPFNLIITPDLSQEPVVDLLAPGGNRFQISPRWLAYFDRTTGQSAIVAAVKPCEEQCLKCWIKIDRFHRGRTWSETECREFAESKVNAEIERIYRRAEGLNRQWHDLLAQYFVTSPSITIPAQAIADHAEQIQQSVAQMQSWRFCDSSQTRLESN